MKVGLPVLIKKFNSNEDRCFDESIFEGSKKGDQQESNILDRG